MFSKGIQIIKILALVTFAFSILSIGYEIADAYNERVANEQNERAAAANGGPVFGIYGDYGDPRKLKRLILVPITFLAFLCIRRFSFVSLALYGLAIVIFLIWLREIYTIIKIDWDVFSHNSPVAIALLAANPFDYALFAAVLILSPTLMVHLFSSTHKGNQSIGESS